MNQISRKTKTRIIIAINLFLVFALMTVSVYAWFASQTDNHVDAYDIQVGANNDLELSFDGKEWAGSLNLSDLKNAVGTSIMETVKLVEVTSDGSTFRIPQLIQKENYAEVNTGGSWTTAKPNQDYIEFTVHMRSKDKLSVYLSSESEATAASSILKGSNCENPSTYASGEESFSKDCIVGALRVSYTNSDGEKNIWITNPEFHLNNKIGSSEYTMDINANSKSYANGSAAGEVGNDFYWNNPKTHYYYNGSVLTTFDSSKTLYKLPDNVETNPSDVTSTKLAVLDGTPDENGYYTGETTFRVWIEGCDTEARRALVSGKFNLSLVLDTFDVE